MKKFMLLLVVSSLFIVILLSGCGGTPQTPPPPTQPVMCSLRVISSCYWCYGNVYLNGFPTGQYLITYGSVTIQNVPCGQIASVYIIDEEGYMSHTEYVTPTGPNTIVNFTYW